jgi:hypothetical protein
MLVQISDKAREETIGCQFSFQCLDDEKRCICIIEKCLEGDGCFLKTVKPQPCPYKMSFGYTYMCHCPTRIELFNRYKI